VASLPHATRVTRTSGLRVWLSRFVAACLLAVAFGYVPYRVLGEQGLRRALRLEDEVKAQKARIVALRHENQELRHDVHALRTDLRAVERVARDELGMVKDHEVVFQIEGAGAAPERELGQ
jgi:cell division protein FtsB